MTIRTDIPELHHWHILTDSELERIREAALDILQNIGFRILSRPILERLERLGLCVDYTTFTVCPTPNQMAQVEQTARSHANQVIDEPVLRRPLPTGERVGHNFTCYYDSTEGARRSATLQDIRNVVQAWHMLPEISASGPCMTAQDVPPPIEPIISTVETMKLTDKITGGPELMLAEQLPFLEQLETIMTGQQVNYHTNGCSVNAFTLDERAAACLLAVAANGLEGWWINSCPIAGANAPVTLAGATVVGVAETMGGWLAGWALNQNVKLWAIPLSGIMDMRTTRVMFSTPESILIDSALYQYFYRMYGVRIGLCIGYTDAKTPGMQALNDKLLKSLAYGLFTDHLGGQTGILEAGNIYSPTQQVIDLELNRQTAQLARGIPVSDDTLALAEIDQYLAGHHSSFLSMDHTLQHWRNSLWMPTLMDRTPFEPPEQEKQKEMQIVERAEARWRDAMASYMPPSLDKHKLKAAEDVVARAKARLL